MQPVGKGVGSLTLRARDDTSSVAAFGDATCLACGLGQVAALTAHRAVIHYRALRFATLKGKAWPTVILRCGILQRLRRFRMTGVRDAPQSA